MRGELENCRRSGRSKKITPRDYRKLISLVKVNRRDTISDITLKFNENNVNPAERKTLQYHLDENVFKRSPEGKMAIKEVNRKKRLSWCREK